MRCQHSQRLDADHAREPVYRSRDSRSRSGVVLERSEIGAEALRDRCARPGMRMLQTGVSENASHEFVPHDQMRNPAVAIGTRVRPDPCRARAARL
jgi:hypothetical protein